MPLLLLLQSSEALAAVLAPGETYSIQLQARDVTQQYTYTADLVYVHVNDATVAAPTLTAEPDCTTAVSVTLELTKAVPADGDVLTTEIEVTFTPAGEDPEEPRTYRIGTGTTLLLNLCPAGVYSWRAQHTDEHDMVGAWPTADEFTVTLAGSLPVVTLAPLAPSVDTTPRSYWLMTDLDRRPQTYYRVQIASDAGFSTIVQDSGEFPSTNLYHQHTTLAVGTWYRRVMAKAGDWSEWVDDSFVIQALVGQSDKWLLYCNGVQIDPALYPASAPTVTKKSNAPLEFSFGLANFDDRQGGVNKGDDILLYIVDTEDNRMEFRGLVVDIDLGRFAQFKCQDIAFWFARWGVDLSLDHASMGQVLQAIITNPSGFCETGIVCRIEEPEDPKYPGSPIIMTAWRGKGQKVGAVLADFAEKTGFKWEIYSAEGSWYFHFWNPANARTFPVTLKNNIDYGLESSSEWVVLNEVKRSETMRDWANQVRYRATYEPPSLPPGISKWDEVWTEATMLWIPYPDVTISFDTTAKTAGTGSIKVEHTQYGPARFNRGPIPLCYVLVPSRYRDWENCYYSHLVFAHQWDLLLNDVSEVGFKHFGQGWLRTTAHSGSDVGPEGGQILRDVPLGGLIGPLAERWRLGCGAPINIDFVRRFSVVDSEDFDANNVLCFSFSLVFPGNGTYPDYFGGVLEEGDVYKTQMWFDNMGLDYLGDRWAGLVKSGEFTVCTAEVDARTETPVEKFLTTPSLTQTEGRAISLMWLALVNAGQVFVNSGWAKSGKISGLQLHGMRRIPLDVNVPVDFTKPTISGSYPVSQIDWRPGEAGFTTEVQLGDMPATLAAGLDRVKHGISNLISEG